jgi:hypothetical protein
MIAYSRFVLSDTRVDGYKRVVRPLILILSFTSITFVVPRCAVAAEPSHPTSVDSSDAEASYAKDLERRAADVLNALNLNDAAKAARVHDAVVARYRELRAWHDANDAKVKSLAGSTDAAATTELATIAESRRVSHDAFLATLAADLTPAQVETVKDRMTYNVTNVTYAAYLDEVPTLTEAQRAQIRKWLEEAREIAMDEGSSKEKHAVFGRYKGRINNYLSKEGYDMKKEEAAWRERLKARRAAAATQKAPE